MVCIIEYAPLRFKTQNSCQSLNTCRYIKHTRWKHAGGLVTFLQTRSVHFDRLLWVYPLFLVSLILWLSHIFEHFPSALLHCWSNVFKHLHDLRFVSPFTCFLHTCTTLELDFLFKFILAVFTCVTQVEKKSTQLLPL